MEQNKMDENNKLTRYDFLYGMLIFIVVSMVALFLYFIVVAGAVSLGIEDNVIVVLIIFVAALATIFSPYYYSFNTVCGRCAARE